MSAPDYGAEVSRADAAIRSLRHAIAGLIEAQDSLSALGASPGVADVRAVMLDIEKSHERIVDLIRRETACRDAAEHAMWAENACVVDVVST